MLAKTIQIIAGLLGIAIKSFAFAIMILEIFWGVLLACVCFWIAGNSSLLRGVIAAVLAFVLVTICGIIIATYFAAVCVVRRAVTDAGIGKMIFDRLFEHLLGVPESDTGEQPASARVPVKMSSSEVESKLKAAARVMLAEDLSSTKLARPLFWFAKQIEKVSIWATVKVIVKSCSHEGNSVNLYDVRERLVDVIDDRVVKFASQYFLKLALLLISVASSLAVLISLGLRLLPS